MSLINKALKQEQLRRSHGMQDGSAQMMAAAVSGANRRGNQGPKILLGFIGLGLLLTVSITLFAVFGLGLLGGGSAEQPKDSLAKATQPVETESATEAQPAQATQSSQPDLTGNAIEDLSPEELEALKNLIAAKSANGTGATEGIVEDVAQDLISETGAQPEQQQAPSLDLEILNYVESLEVQGARAAGEKSRLLMNGRVYRLNDVIDHEKGLIFKEVQQGFVIFQDRNGADYEKAL